VWVLSEGGTEESAPSHERQLQLLPGLLMKNRAQTFAPAKGYEQKTIHYQVKHLSCRPRQQRRKQRRLSLGTLRDPSTPREIRGPARLLQDYLAHLYDALVNPRFQQCSVMQIISEHKTQHIIKQSKKYNNLFYVHRFLFGEVTAQNSVTF
jgi:hypothetical protein